MLERGSRTRVLFRNRRHPCAVAAIDPEPGDEIITTPITDMGALTPILYQGAIPVFADVDPAHVQRDCQRPSRPAQRAHPRHHRHPPVRQPLRHDRHLELAEDARYPRDRGLRAGFSGEVRRAYVGTIGTIGCFSLQQGKHMTTGEGGLVVTNDEALARRMFLFINKALGLRRSRTPTTTSWRSIIA